MKVLTVKEMRSLEKKAIDNGVNELQLMRKAGFKLVQDFMNRVKPGYDLAITIIAGVGNNGGDALVMAIELKQLGYKPKIFVVGDVKQASEAFLHYFDLAGKVDIINSSEEVNSIQETIFASDYIIDGLFGIGLSKEITGFRKELIEFVNESDTNVYSIDIPAGINPDNGLVMGIAIKADNTGIIGNYKIGNLLNEAMDYHGETEYLNIGLTGDNAIPREIVRLEDYNFESKKRLHTTNKYSCGLGLFIGGNYSMMGSIQMSAYAGLRSGLGIVKVVSNVIDSNFTQFYPEILIMNNSGKDLLPLLGKAKSCVYGPGIEANSNHKLLLDYLLNSDIPLVLDATGLEHIELKEYKNKNIVLTPHLGELSKLLDVSSKEIQKDPLKHLKKLTDLGFTVLLKGSCNIIASKSEVVFIQVKNTGLATAGSGDILSGILAANISKEEWMDSIIKSVYIHRTAANFASYDFGEVSMTASDILNNIHKVYRRN
ncbi:MAG: NAD(P)H-hydrate dehydratase [Tenericutes bacterium]|nr:NAD(P)H-hydrate dehydratase [Mycoplasmatota bacterium]